MRVSMFMAAGFAAILMIGFTNCKKDETPSGTGSVSFEITDAPIDDANIQGVFVTLVTVKVDGQEIDNFSGKQTIDLMAYQKGQVKALGSGSMNAGNYNDVRLVLDYETSATGTSPGSYVLTKDGVKHPLKATVGAANEVKISTGTLNVTENGNATAVIDFDLRKALTYSTTPATSAYQFVTDAELSAATRLAMKTKTGAITGTCTDGLGLAGSKIVVYAYKKGSFNTSETQPQGSSDIMFKNAVTSSVCDASGEFTLTFLEAGEYDLRFVGYQDANNDGKLEEKGALVLDVLGGLNLTSISVSAAATVRLDVTVTGILPL